MKEVILKIIKIEGKLHYMVFVDGQQTQGTYVFENALRDFMKEKDNFEFEKFLQKNKKVRGKR